MVGGGLLILSFVVSHFDFQFARPVVYKKVFNLTSIG